MLTDTLDVAVLTVALGVIGGVSGVGGGDIGGVGGVGGAGGGSGGGGGDNSAGSAGSSVTPKYGSVHAVGSLRDWYRDSDDEAFTIGGRGGAGARTSGIEPSAPVECSRESKWPTSWMAMARKSRHTKQFMIASAQTCPKAAMGEGQQHTAKLRMSMRGGRW